MKRAHKIRLKPTRQQEAYLKKAAGTARFSYNWALATWQEQYEQGERPSAFFIKKQLNQIKREQYPWMLEVTKCAIEQSIFDLGRAFTNFFKGRAKYPKFKKKGVHDSFYLSNDKFELEGKKVKIPKLGWVKTREHLRFDGRILGARVSRKSDRWFISIQMEVPFPVLSTYKNHGVVGLDLGIKNLLVASDNMVYKAPKPLYRNLKKLRRLQKSLHRKKLGSSNREKAKLKLSKLYHKMDNIRKDYLHKLTTYFSSNYETVVIEDLNVNGMLSNRKLARAISDLGFYEFKRQLQYKKESFGGNLVIADKWFPSSKKCSNCGNVKDSLSLSERTYKCNNCYTELDRDLNAALNLCTVGSTGI